MASFYESLKALISQEMTSKIAQVLDEKETSISKASSSIIAGLLGIMAKKGHNTHIKNILEEAGNVNLIYDVGMFDEHLTHPQQNIGDNFLQHLLGDKAADFTTPISKEAGISYVATNRLVSILASSLPAFFGKKLKDGVSYATIIDDIKAQEKSFASKIPADLIKHFGLSTILGTATTTAAHAATHAKPQPLASSTTTTSTPKTPEPKKSRNSWIGWLLGLIVLLLLFFWWRSCYNEKDLTAMSGTETIVEPVNVIAENNPSVSNNPAEAEDVLAITEIILPDGVQVTAYKNGVEENMYNFLSSDEYKKATDKDLQNKWFEFDNIDFEFGSSTQLKEGSKPQLDNVISILKAHKDAKVMVAAFADKKGTGNANMKISKERAKTIEKLLEEGGVGSQVVKIEGLGDTHAKYSADAPESNRAKDRDIALRFVK